MKSNSIPTIWSALIILTLAVTVTFAAPEYINYQGHLTDMDGNPMEGTVSITFNIYSDATGGFARWTETHDAVEITGGHLTAILGELIPFPAEIFDQNQLYLGVTVEADREMTPRRLLTDTGEWNGGNNSTDDRPPNTYSLNTSSTCWGIDNSGSGMVFYGGTTSYDGIAGRFDKAHNGSSGSNPCVYITSSAANAALSVRNTDSYAAAATAGSFQTTSDSCQAPTLYAQQDGEEQAIYGKNTGTGEAGYFEVTSNSNSDPALYVDNDGIGEAGYFLNDYASNDDPVIYAEQQGTGKGIWVKTTNQSSTNATLKVWNDGLGRGAYVHNDNASNTSDALTVLAEGNGGAICAFVDGTLGYAVEANIRNASHSSAALYAYTIGTGEAGYFQINNGSNTDPALYATTNGTGDAGYFNGDVTITGTLQLDGEYILDSGGSNRARIIDNGFTVFYDDDQNRMITITDAYEVCIGDDDPYRIFQVEEDGGHAIADGWDTYARDGGLDSRAIGNADHQSVLSTIQNLNLVTYADDSGKTRYLTPAGSIPEEIKSKDDLGMSLGDAVGFLLAAVQAMEAENANLQEQIDELRAQIK